LTSSGVPSIIRALSPHPGETVAARIRPLGPYSLALTARGASDATRVWRDGVLRAVVGGEQASAMQLADRTVVVRGSDEAVERMRWLLAVEADHSEFLQRFKRDRMLRGPIAHLAGMRVLRVDTVAQALLRALCGQLIEARRARAIERRIIRAFSAPVGDLHAAPSTDVLARAAPAEYRAHGLHARRGATLVRLCRAVELERLHALPIELVEERLVRERGLGPWSLGVVALEGLGRSDRGLVGDLGLVKLAIALRGRWVEAHETAELLEPYAEWSGLASVYLMVGFARGLVPVPDGARIRRPPHRISSRAA
jgi:3-methyladenine DNA glycosylase/8-oxoguanine DNA glycosylase